jgi:hypothetical protein
MSVAAVPALKEAGRECIMPRFLRLARRCLLIALALGLAWLLVSAEREREEAAGCHRPGYRDPVTGRQLERSCPPA